MWAVSWGRFGSEVSWIVAVRALVFRTEALMASVTGLRVDGRKIVQVAECPAAACAPEVLR